MILTHFRSRFIVGLRILGDDAMEVQRSGCECEATMKGWCPKHYVRKVRQEVKGTSGCIALG